MTAARDSDVVDVKPTPVTLEALDPEPEVVVVERDGTLGALLAGHDVARVGDDLVAMERASLGFGDCGQSTRAGEGDKRGEDPARSPDGQPNHVDLPCGWRSVLAHAGRWIVQLIHVLPLLVIVVGRVRERQNMDSDD